MAKMSNTLSGLNPEGTADAYATSIGNAPEVSTKDLSPENRVVSSVDQAISIVNTLQWDAQKLVKNAARITSLKQRRKPYDIKKLEKQGKGYKTNLSSGAYSTTLTRVAPRLYMPLLNASTLVASELPAGTVNGEQKTKHYREVVTNAIRSWPRWRIFVRLLLKEVVDYGFVFAAFTDRYEWRPHLCRMDRGFVPAGTEVMDLEPAFFALKWDYQPSTLIRLVKDAEDAGIEGWDVEAVAEAVQVAKPVTAPTREPTGWRKWEELIREQVWNYGTSKNFRVVESIHLFALETTGKVSHYILVKDTKDTKGQDGDNDGRMLYQQEDAFDSMADAVIPLTFNSTDGTIHGSWGAGHLLYDLGGLQEKIFCDTVDNLRNANKQRLQVADPKDINDVKQVVNDTEVIVSGAQFANNLGGVQQNVDAYIALKGLIQQTMDSTVGAYVPPIPLQSSDIKAAQVNAAMAQEKEISDDSVDYALDQAVFMIRAMERRLTDPESPNETTIQVLKDLRTKLNDDEISSMRDQTNTRSITAFTPGAAQSKGQFAQQMLGNQLFKQTELAKLVAEGVPGGGGSRLAEAVVIQDGDQTEATAARRQQVLENTAMLFGQDVPVLTTDNHWIHMQTLKQPLIQAIQQGVPTAEVGLRHFTAHWSAGVALKVLPPASINAEKSFIADAEKAILAQQQQRQQQQQMQQGQQGGPPGMAPQLGAPQNEISQAVSAGGSGASLLGVPPASQPAPAPLPPNAFPAA